MKKQKAVPGILPRLVFTNGYVYLSSSKKPRAVKPDKEKDSKGMGHSGRPPI